MKSLATSVLAGLMLLGTISAIATTKHSNQLTGYTDGGPVPLCDPSTTPDCPPAVPSVKASAATDGGPVPLCDPTTTPNCPPAVPSAR
jgi:hypothetical protein